MTSLSEVERLEPGPRDAKPGRGYVVLAAYAVVAFLVYWPALRGGWLWDDTLDITENLLLRDAAGLWKIWFAPTTLDYYPLKFTVQWLQWQLWGDNVVGYHVTNVVLHAAGAWLLYRVFERLGLRHAWLGGLLFVVHPLAVESVAWMAELKNTLSLPPLLLSLLAWLDFDEHRRARDYRRALAWFVIAMLCKTAVVMFPVTLLLFIWWRHARVTWRDLPRLAPFFAVSLVLGLVTVWFQQSRGLGGETIHLGPPMSRAALASSALGFYAWKTIWPAGLLPIYPQWAINPPDLRLFAPWLVLAGLAAWCWQKRATWGRHALLGGGWFVLHLFPFVGVIAISFMRFTWVMDHLAYFALPGAIGLFLAVPQRANRTLVAAAAVAVCTVLGWTARTSAATYRDPLTFWAHAVRGHPDSAVARNNLGLAHAAAGNLAAAVPQYERALALDPKYFEPRMNLGNALRQLGRTQEGLAHLKQAVQLRPSVAAAHFNLGVALEQDAAAPGEALAAYSRAIELKPAFADALDARGELLRAAGRRDEAQRDFEAALRVDPNLAPAHLHLGILLQASGRIADARRHLEAALRLKPDYAEAHNNFATILVKDGSSAEAVRHLQRAVELRPDFVDARSNLAMVLVQLGRADEALPHFEAVLRQQPRSLRAHYHLANVLLSGGEARRAIEHYEHALALDESYAEIHAKLAEALAAVGRNAEARTRHARARALDPNVPARDFPP